MVEQAFPASPLAPRAGLGGAPADFQTTRDDQVRIVTVNSQSGVELSVAGRLTDQGGQVTPVQRTVTPNTDRTTGSDDFIIGAGGRLNLTVQASAGAPRIGQTYVIAQLVRGIGGVQVVIATLFAGYVTANQPLGMPGSLIEDSITRGGVIRFITGTDPSGGNEVLEIVPTGARWQVLAFGATLSTSAVAGTRRPQLRFSDQFNVYMESVSNRGLSESNGGTFYWSADAWLAAQVAAVGSTAGLPADCQLIANHAIGTATIALDAGDNWNAPFYVVREWLEVS